MLLENKIPVQKYSKSKRLFASFASAALASGLASAHADTGRALPFDSPTMVGDVESVCTGIGMEAREDPRWSNYPLKVVLAGEGGQYLGEAQLTIEKAGAMVVDIRCGGPWALFKLEPGQYSVTATIENTSVKSTAYVSAKKQGRLVMRFPIGGSISAEHQPAME